jgi:hypothetical protein
VLPVAEIDQGPAPGSGRHKLGKDGLRVLSGPVLLCAAVGQKIIDIPPGMTTAERAGWIAALDGPLAELDRVRCWHGRFLPS